MKKDFDFDRIPVTFAYCLQNECVRKEECLRGRMFRSLPADYPLLTVVNPSHTALQGECRYFKSSEKVRLAVGMERMFDNIPHPVAKEIMRTMRMQLGNTEYYRFKRKEKAFTPALQDYVRSVFVQHGVADEPVFDKYFDSYLW